MAAISTIAAIVGMAAGANSIYQSTRNNSIAQRAAAQGASAADPAGWARHPFQEMLLSRFGDLSTVDPKSIENDPQYQFLRGETLAASDGEAAAAGLYRSGTRWTDRENRVAGLTSSFIDKKFQQNMSVMDRIMQAGGFTTGSPGAAGQIIANGGIQGQNIYDRSLEQIGGGLNMLNRNWGNMFSGGGMGYGTADPVGAGFGLPY